MKRPLKRRIRSLKSRAARATIKGHGHAAYRLKLQAQTIAQLAKECRQ